MRERIVETIIYCMMGLLLAGFFNLQIRHGNDYRRMSERNRIRTIPIVAGRGRIYDREGRILADNKPIFNVSVIPDDFDQEYTRQIADIVSLDADALAQKIVRARHRAGEEPLLIKKDISRTAFYRLEELSTLVGGITITQDSLRFYPEGEMVCHVVGYIGKINEKEYEENKHRGWLINDYVGRLGVEKAYDERIRGKPGGRQIEVDAHGRELRTLSKKEPVLGEDIHLTIDADLQRRIVELIDQKYSIAICVVDVHTGAILALVSTPLFDPNMFLDPSRRDELAGALHDQRHPFVNRTISLTYPPGSVFKVLIGLAGLEEGVINSGTIFHCSGVFKLNDRARPFHCWNPYGHGDISLREAIAQSCNIYFCQLGLKLGNARIARYARLFGFGKPIDLGLPYSKPGLVPDALWKKDTLQERWYPGETISYAIGQGFLAVTPLQIAKLMAIIANNGRIVEPHINADETIPDGHVPIARKNFAIMRGCMLEAINSEHGTGHLAQPKYFKMAGKTGTAQTNGEPHSWYAGFFPYNDPQIALVVMAEHAGPGGIVAAGYAGKIADTWSAWNEEKKKKDTV